MDRDSSIENHILFGFLCVCEHAMWKNVCKVHSTASSIVLSVFYWNAIDSIWIIGLLVPTAKKWFTLSIEFSALTRFGLYPVWFFCQFLHSILLQFEWKCNQWKCNTENKVMEKICGDRKCEINEHNRWVVVLLQKCICISTYFLLLVDYC